MKTHAQYRKRLKWFKQPEAPMNESLWGAIEDLEELLPEYSKLELSNFVTQQILRDATKLIRRALAGEKITLIEWLGTAQDMERILKDHHATH
jgi:hypothetical protein